MKRTVFVSLLLAMLPWVVSAQSVDDDLYYTPKKSKQKTTTTTVKEPVKEVKVSSGGQVNVWAPNASTVVVRDKKGNVRDVDEYNRRYSAQENKFSMENDTLYIDEREDSDLRGEWIDGFEGSQDDYEYAVRLIRFQNPRYAIPVSSPLYWDIVYAQSYVPWDWNVYDDGMYAYIFPTFSNRLWWDWRFNSFGSWGWGWNSWRYSPYYSWGWGWNWGYGPSWGWGGWYDPFYHNHWYAHGPSWGWGGGGHFGRPSYRPNDRPATAQRGHDRNNRFNSGTRFSGTSVKGNSGSNGNRYSGTRVNGSSDSHSSGRFNGVQGYRSTSNQSSSSVRPSTSGTRGDRFNGGSSSGTSTVRSTSSYVRPNSVRSNSNTYSRPSSTRSSNSNSNYNYNSNRTTRESNSSYQNNSSRSYDSGSSVRSSGFSSGSSSRSSGTSSGGSRSGGGRSRR